MSTRRLRGRLDRLTQSAKSTPAENKLPAYNFPIDPALANALRDDYKRLDELYQPPTGSTETPETEEERMLRARMAERAKTITVPVGYGLHEVWDDRARLAALRRRDTQNTDDDIDAQEAQVIARLEAFAQGPEGLARARIKELKRRRRGWMTRSEHYELDELLALYPEPDIDPRQSMSAFSLAIEKVLEGLRKEDFKRQEILAKKHNLRF